MPPLLTYLIRRLLFFPITLIVITIILFSIAMLTPPKDRAMLYVNIPPHLMPDQVERLLGQVAERYGLNDPMPVQYVRWLGNLARGEWGYSPVIEEDVFSALVNRSAVTAELTLYSLILLLPLGIICGAFAAWRAHWQVDILFRLTAFIATSIPSFILGLVLIAIFYVALHLLPIERMSYTDMEIIRSPSYHVYTGLLTIDGLLNGRIDVTLSAFRHLAMPVATLSLAHWAILARVTRASMIEELQKEYIVAARARGLHDRIVVWKHALRNALPQALTSTILSAASLLTGVYVVEAVFNLNGVSSMVVSAFGGVVDVPTALGFAIYSVLAVLAIMLILDILLALIDPRIRKGVAE